MSATAPVRCSAADRRRQILQAATQLFARQGFQGTTTRAIAGRAQVNEALIFRHFGSKEDLYWAVIEHECRSGGEARQQKCGNGSDHEFFASLAEDMLERRAADSTLSRLLLFTALEDHRLSHRFFRTYMARYFEMLAGYVRRGESEGRFRHIDPLLATRSFLGMVIYHSWMQELFGYKRYQKFDNTEVARALADIWLRGMAAGKQAEADLSGHKPGKGRRRSRKNHDIA